MKIQTSLAIIIVIFVASCVLWTPPSSFLFVNKAGEPISKATVTVCGQTIKLNDIKPAKSARGSYTASESHYDITVEFQSGRRLHKSVGYVTSGMVSNDEIVVSDSDIEIANSDARPLPLSLLAIGIVEPACQLAIIVTLLRNMIIRKSVIGWLFPSGSTKRERVIFISCLLVIVISEVLGRLLAPE